MTTKDLLVEIGTEELPPAAIKNLSAALQANLEANLDLQQISFKSSQYFATPRRLAVIISGVSLQQPEQIITRRGPAIKAAYDKNNQPTPAAIGFAKSCGVNLEQLSIHETNKGSWLQYKHNKQGQETKNLLPEILGLALDKLPIAKKMRWGAQTKPFVRPVHWIVFLFDNQTIKTKLFGITSGNTSYGHRFHSPGAVTIQNPQNYLSSLEKAFVICDINKRQELIISGINQAAQKLKNQPIINQELLELVTGLVEYPVVLTAEFNRKYLHIPRECLISTLENHQKVFAVENTSKQLQASFIIISNISSSSPQTVINGNQKVVNARLADAAFYFATDKQKKLENHVNTLKTVIFQQKLGSLYDKTIRIQKIASFIANSLNINTPLIERAALLCKTDLMTHMVYEFPELQGIMGYYYALDNGESDQLATAIKEYYLPKHAQDIIPTSDLGTVLALADRIDSLVGLFAIEKKPSGDKDPFALRRQALAVLIIIIEKKLDLNLKTLFEQAINQAYNNLPDLASSLTPSLIPNLISELLTFCTERLRAWYLQQNISASSFLAVADINTNSPYDFHLRLSAINNFQSLPEAASLAAANKRVYKLLEKSSSNQDFTQHVFQEKLLELAAEKDLFQFIKKLEDQITPLLEQNNYTESLKILAQLKTPIDSFFDQVMVMVDNKLLQYNRLCLLKKLYNLFSQVANISLL